MKWLQVLLLKIDSIQQYAFICTQSDGSKYFYVIQIIPFRHTVKKLLLFSANNSTVVQWLKAMDCGIRVSEFKLKLRYYEFKLKLRYYEFKLKVTLLRSLLDKYPWERYEFTYPPSYGLNSTTTAPLEG